VAVLVDVQNTLVENALLRWGSPEQKTRYCPKLASEWVGSYALSEAGSGSDAFALKARAERRSDRFVLNGRKLWITNAHESSLFIVFANVDPEKGYKGITASWSSAAFQAFPSEKRKTSWASALPVTCELLARRLRSATRERAR